MSSATVLDGLRQALATHTPFGEMEVEDLDFLISRVEVGYYGPGEIVLAPGGRAPEHLFIIKQGRVRGENPHDDNATAFEGGAGDCFPVGALLAERPVSLLYRSVGDTFVLLLARRDFNELARRSQVFLDFCKRRLGSLLDLSRQQIQAAYAADTNAQRTLATPVGQLVRREALRCPPQTPLKEVLARMHESHADSIIVVEAAGKGERVAGILTRTDLIGRVMLAELPLSTPVADVMTRGVISLAAEASAADATMLMAEHSIRHVPVMLREAGAERLAGVISERDLFEMQRLTVRELALALRRADDVAALSVVAQDIRRLSYHLVAQGVGAAELSRLISHLTDQLSSRLLQLACERFALDPARFCWLSFGSEGRREQTIATDQDNGIIYEAGAEGGRLLELAAWVNQSLAVLGFPLCKGGIMASNPLWCLPAADWRAKFGGWIERGSPQALLNASIFFDFRPVFGQAALANDLRDEVVARARATPRFLKQMADNALRNRPLDFGGVIDSLFRDPRKHVLDLKMNATVLFVDAARIWALAAGLHQTNTTERLRRLAEGGHLPEREAAHWTDAFEFFQLLRLRTQHRHSERGETVGELVNQVEIGALSPLERRIVREGLRQARKAQSRLRLDFPG